MSSVPKPEDKTSGSSPPKRFKSSPRAVGLKKVDFPLRKNEEGLTSDAQLSEESIEPSQLAQQPLSIWYGACARDEPDTSTASVPATGKSDQRNIKKARSTKPLELRSHGIRTRKRARVEEKMTIGHGTAHAPGAIGHMSMDMVDSVEGYSAPTLSPTRTGRGTIVAVLDSGINIHHTAFRVGENSFLSEKIIGYSRSFVGGDLTDSLGHGTQCAGLLCGSKDAIQIADSDLVPFQGIAPDAQIMACKVVCDGTEIANIEAVCNAIDHILTYNRQCADTEKVDVISMSFGMAGFDYNLARKIQEAVYEDIIVICAASNQGRNGHQPITYPARLGHVLCIGACTAGGKPTDFCPIGRELDFLAPGEGIWAPTVGRDNAYCIVSGTSFAAPLVAGIVCQIIEDTRRLSEKTPNEDPPLWHRVHNVWCAREILKEMAVVRGKHSDHSGYGKLDPRQYFEKDDAEKLRIIHKIYSVN